MKVCFYADSYLILNFILNLYLLYITALLRQKHYHLFRFILAAVISSGISVIIACFYLKYGGNFIWLAGVVEMLLLLKIAFRPETKMIWAKDFFFCFVITVFTGGFLLLIKEQLFRWSRGTEQLSLKIIIVGLFFLTLAVRFFHVELLHQIQKEETILKGILKHEGKEIEVKVLWDTGNQLTSPYTGEEVCIISQELAEKLSLLDKQGLLIPFHSIGGGGMLQAHRLDELILQDGTRKEKFLAGISENMGVQKEIQIILNIHKNNG